MPTAYSEPRNHPKKGYAGALTADGKSTRGGFQIVHYAAAVIYDVDGWTDKNKDSLTDDMYKAIASSKLPAREALPQSPSLLNRFVDVRAPPVSLVASACLPLLLVAGACLPLVQARSCLEVILCCCGQEGKKVFKSLGSNFRDSLVSLIDETLLPCKCSFVRCLKPNKEKVSNCCA